MKYVGDKMHHYCETCGTRRRIVRCRYCWGEGNGCYACDRSGYACEKTGADRKHRWKKSWS